VKGKKKGKQKIINLWPPWQKTIATMKLCGLGEREIKTSTVTPHIDFE